MAILNGWKEIAVYLNRGVRTVQRWEDFGLPVRRPAGHSRSAVITTSEELDQWVSRTPAAMRDSELTALRARAEIVLRRHLRTIDMIGSAARKMEAIGRAYGIS